MLAAWRHQATAAGGPHACSLEPPCNSSSNSTSTTSSNNDDDDDDDNDNDNNNNNNNNKKKKKKKKTNKKKNKHKKCNKKMCGTMVSSCGIKRTSHCALHLLGHAEHMNNTNGHTTIHNPYGLASPVRKALQLIILKPKPL